MEINKTIVSLAVAGLFATAIPFASIAGSDSESHYYGVDICNGQAVCQGHGFSEISEAAEQENGFIKVGFRTRGFHNRRSFGRSFGRFGHRRGFSGFGHRSFRRFNRNGFGYYNRFRPQFGFKNYGNYGYRGHI